MKKILENIEKDELLEYYRSSNGKFAVGNFVGINNDFAIFTSISPFGRFEGYRFIKLEDLKNIGKRKLYLEIAFLLIIHYSLFSYFLHTFCTVTIGFLIYH